MLGKALVLGALLLASATASAAKPEDYVGVWGVTMTATYSTCKSTKVGDVKSEEWNFNVESGKIKVVSQGGLGTNFPAQTGRDDFLLDDGDRLRPVLTAIAGAPANGSIEVVLEHTISAWS